MYNWGFSVWYRINRAWTINVKLRKYFSQRRKILLSGKCFFSLKFSWQVLIYGKISINGRWDKISFMLKIVSIRFWIQTFVLYSSEKKTCSRSTLYPHSFPLKQPRPTLPCLQKFLLKFKSSTSSSYSSPSLHLQHAFHKPFTALATRTY